MHTRRIALCLSLVLLGLVFAIPARGQGGIIVNGADAVRTTSVTSSLDLTNSLAGVQARVVVEYSNAVRHANLISVPAAFQTVLGQVTPRVTVEYANAIRHTSLNAPPNAFQNLLTQITNRIVIQYANASRQILLAYPAALLNDTTTPQISGVTVTNGKTINWLTDEFATSVVMYGTQSGMYPQTASDLLYTKQHAITLIGLTTGTTYYYRLQSTDLSGNTTTSAEYSLTGQIPVYMPVIVR